MGYFNMVELENLPSHMGSRITGLLEVKNQGYKDYDIKEARMHSKARNKRRDDCIHKLHKTVHERPFWRTINEELFVPVNKILAPSKCQKCGSPRVLAHILIENEEMWICPCCAFDMYFNEKSISIHNFMLPQAYHHSGIHHCCICYQEVDISLDCGPDQPVMVGEMVKHWREEAYVSVAHYKCKGDMPWSIPAKIDDSIHDWEDESLFMVYKSNSLDLDMSWCTGCGKDLPAGLQRDLISYCPFCGQKF